MAKLILPMKHLPSQKPWFQREGMALKPFLFLVVSIAMSGCSSNGSIDLQPEPGWDLEEPSTARPSSNEPEIIVHAASEMRDMSYPSVRGCEDDMEASHRASFWNGLSVEFFGGDPPKANMRCTFPDGTPAPPVDAPPFDHHDVYLQFGDANTLHKFEVRFHDDGHRPDSRRRKVWIVPFVDGVDLVIYAGRKRFNVSLLPREPRCTFPDAVDHDALLELMSNIRIIYGGLRPNTQDYYYWDYGVLEPMKVEWEEGRQFAIYMTGFHNLFSDCTDPTPELRAQQD